MMVKCVKNSVLDITSRHSIENYKKYSSLESVSDYLCLGRNYLVFGVVYRDGVPWYLICEDPSDNFPRTHISEFFQIVDARLPPGWSFLLGRSTNAGEGEILPDVWGRDPAFLEKLVDEVPDAIREFRQLQADLERFHVRPVQSPASPEEPPQKTDE